MKTTELTDLQQMIALWKEKGITECSMEFNCGGDQMNDYTFTFYTKEGQVECEELDSYFDGEVYNNVEFYVNSDGHYMGESGYVYITLDDDEESFSYRKDAESEWNETFTGVDYFKLTDDYKKFLQEKVQSIVGGEDGEAINYKGDCILTDEEEEIAEKIQSELHDFAYDMEMPDAEGEASEWFRFTTNRVEDDDDDSNGLTITDEGLMVSVERTHYVYKPSED
jgi:hypothetical protein